mgnify:FL=1
MEMSFGIYDIWDCPGDTTASPPSQEGGGTAVRVPECRVTYAANAPGYDT